MAGINCIDYGADGKAIPLPLAPNRCDTEDGCTEGRGMGLGALGSGGIIFKRKFRWTMTILYCDDDRQVAEEFVKVGGRPNLELEEIEINYLHGKMYIPGKGTWQPITVTYYDVAGTADVNVDVNGIFGWLASLYDIFVDPICLQMGSKLSDYAGTAALYLYDGCGQN